MRTVLLYIIRRDKVNLVPIYERVKKDFVATHTWEERWKRGSRPFPKLLEAVQTSNETGLRLVIANAGRLIRSVTFLRPLLQAKQFICWDQPEVCETTLPMIYATEQFRSQEISNKMRDLAAEGAGRTFAWRSEKRCVKGAAKGLKKSNEARTAQARAIYDDIVPLVRQQRAEGKTFQQIADDLNAIGVRTVRGNPLSQPVLCNIMARYDNPSNPRYLGNKTGLPPADRK